MIELYIYSLFVIYSLWVSETYGNSLLDYLKWDIAKYKIILEAKEQARERAAEKLQVEWKIEGDVVTLWCEPK